MVNMFETHCHLLVIHSLLDIQNWMVYLKLMQKMWENVCRKLLRPWKLNTTLATLIRHETTFKITFLCMKNKFFFIEVLLQNPFYSAVQLLPQWRCVFSSYVAFAKWWQGSLEPCLRWMSQADSSRILTSFWHAEWIALHILFSKAPSRLDFWLFALVRLWKECSDLQWNQEVVVSLSLIIVVWQEWYR